MHSWNAQRDKRTRCWAMNLYGQHILTRFSCSVQGDALIQIYHNVVAELEFKLNKLKIAHIAVAVSSRYVRRAPLALPLLGWTLNVLVQLPDASLCNRGRGPPLQLS